MPLQKTPVQVTFGSVEQKRGGKFLLPGRLKIAENVYQAKTKEYRKRNGFVPMDRVPDFGSIATGADLATTGDMLVMRTIDSVYVRSATQGVWERKGLLTPVTAQLTGVAPIGAERPAHCVENGRIWTTWFSSGVLFYSVIEQDSGNEIQPPTQLTGLFGIPSNMTFAKPVAAAASVWIFIGPQTTGANTITLAKMSTGAPGGAPTVTTFANPSGTWQAWDVLDAGGNGVIFGYLGSLDFADGSGTTTFSVAKLNTGTGLPGTWTHNSGGGTGPAHFVRNAVGGDGFFYFACNASGNLSELKINATTLVIAGPTTVAPTVVAKGGVVGYQEPGTNNRIYFNSTDNLALRDDAFIDRVVWTGSVATVTSKWHRAASIASDPFLIGSQPYLMITHDDGKGLQGGYTIVDAVTGSHLSRSLYQLGGNHWFVGSVPLGADKMDYGWVTTVHVASGKVYTQGQQAGSLLFGGFANAYLLDRMVFDFADTMLGPALAALNGRTIVFPGGWPMALAAESSALQELGPAMYPRQNGTVTASGGGSGLTAGTYQVGAVYANLDRDGNVARSSPSALSAVVVAGGNNIVAPTPTDRWTNNNFRMLIELYISNPNQVEPMFLVQRVANDPTVDSITITAGQLPAAGQEILYTDGGVLDNIAPPSFRVAFAWSGPGGYRVFLTGTDVLGEVWPSKEVVPGVGPLWNETFRFSTRWGTGPVTAGGVVDGNYAALFKQDAVIVISGPGPDPSGHGGFVPQLVADAPGCSRPRSLVSGPQGCFYQAVTGEIWLVNHGAQGLFISGGVDDYQTEPVTAAVHWQERSLVCFFTGGASGTTSRVMVWDYGNPLAEEGSLGQWYVWNIPTPTAPVGACIQAGALYFLTSDGQVWKETPGQYFDTIAGVQTPIFRKLKVPLALGGVRGYQRYYRGQVVGQFKAAHSLKVTLDSYDGAPGEAGSTTESWTKAVASGPELFEFKPTQGKVTIVDVTMEDVGTDLTEGATFDGLGLEVGIKGGLPRVNSGSRL